MRMRVLPVRSLLVGPLWLVGITSGQCVQTHSTRPEAVQERFELCRAGGDNAGAQDELICDGDRPCRVGHVRIVECPVQQNDLNNCGGDNPGKVEFVSVAHLWDRFSEKDTHISRSPKTKAIFNFLSNLVWIRAMIMTVWMTMAISVMTLDMLKKFSQVCCLGVSKATRWWRRLTGRTYSIVAFTGKVIPRRWELTLKGNRNNRYDSP